MSLLDIEHAVNEHASEIKSDVTCAVVAMTADGVNMTLESEYVSEWHTMRGTLDALLRAIWQAQAGDNTAVAVDNDDDDDDDDDNNTNNARTALSHWSRAERAVIESRLLELYSVALPLLLPTDGDRVRAARAFADEALVTYADVYVCDTCVCSH
jgi:hypothetical protein